MNSPSILDLERLSLAESHTLHPLPSPDSSHPAPTLCSLPPELVSHIFDCTLTPLSSKATLASLCRVNLYFLEIARPLLYHHIHLNPSIDRNKHSSRYSQLVDTVLFAKHCADLVRSIEITVEADRTELDWTLLRCVLGRCKRLKKFSTGWREWKGSKADQDRLIEAISEEATSIEHLELPYIPLELSATMRLVSALSHLRILLFVPVYTSPQIVPLYSLQKVVWQSRMVNRALGIYLSSSRYTLTSLSFQFNYAKPPMLDMFPNLSTLRLILDGFRTIENSNNASTRTPDEDCLDAVRATLLSTRSLPVKHLTISTKFFVTAESVADYCMLDCLPPTIVSFTGVPQFFGILNLPSLVRLSRTAGIPSYPDLRRLTIAPPLFTASVDGETHKLMDTTSRRVSKVLASNGVDVIVDLGAKLGEQFGPPMSIPPLPSLVHSFPPPNPPLPPELIDQIIRSLPLYPARNRRRALGRCCLVNRLFLDISRPLLYNEVPAMLEEPEEAAGRQLDRLTETLASSSACREMVKGVKLSTYEGELGLDGYESVDVFLGVAKQLEAVRVVWIGEEGLDESGFDVSPMFSIRSDKRIGYYLVTSILRHQPGLKQLVLPTQCHLEYATFAAVFTKLLNLETFVGSFVTIPGNDNKPFLSPCHLRHLTICSRFEHLLFRQVVHSSCTSLTSFTFPLDTADNPLDLSIFPNLNYLHISLRSRPALSVINRTYATTSEHFARFVAQTLRPLLLSAQSLAISTFKITTPSQNVETFMSQQQIFDLLPPTLAHLTSNPLLLRAHESNFEILAKDMRDRSYPHLKTIVLQPSGTPDRFNREEEVKQAVERVCRLFKIQLDVIDREEECCRMEEKWRETWWSESEEESEG